MKNLFIGVILLLSVATSFALEIKGFKPDKTVIYKSVDEIDLKLDIFNPDGHQPTDKKPAILFFFGGGWSKGSMTQFHPFSDYIAKRGMVAICVDYRVSSRHETTPKECVQDGKSAMRWVRKHAAELGVDPDKILAGGGSAGGHIAAAVATLKGFNEKGEDENSSTRPVALVLCNPVFDNGPKGYGHKRVEAYWKEFSPMHNISKSTPPTIVFLGTKDKFIPVSTAEKYKELMEKSGGRCDLHIYQDETHGFFNHKKAKYPEVIQDMDKFLVSLGYLDAQK